MNTLSPKAKYYSMFVSFLISMPAALKHGHLLYTIKHRLILSLCICIQPMMYSSQRTCLNQLQNSIHDLNIHIQTCVALGSSHLNCNQLQLPFFDYVITFQIDIKSLIISIWRVSCVIVTSYRHGYLAL